MALRYFSPSDPCSVNYCVASRRSVVTPTYSINCCVTSRRPAVIRPSTASSSGPPTGGSITINYIQHTHT
ncbi:unnamed protein product [Linum trigynum]|uniref:Uncharacterized protein n=1 Tax=Linum trigynum TaxID=586398 RepID=A0AAV2F931_9ROSI